MPNSGFSLDTDTGWISGSGGTSGFTSAHRIFPDLDKVERTDGQPFDVYSIVRQAAKTTCEICGAWIISTDYPTAPFRHMTADEIKEYVKGSDDDA